MRSTSPTLMIVAASALLLAGCSQKSEDAAADASAETEPSADAVAAAADAAVSAGENEVPGLTSSAASDVAFSYRYAFTLPVKAISSVQQQHATACERLGPTRCKITGMRFEQPKPDEASARLDLLLAPELAQRFGGDAIAAVERAEGVLETANVDGEDAGGAIEASQRDTGIAKAALARIEKRLELKGLGTDERRELLRRADELRGQIGNEVRLRQDREAALAMTPVSFAYASEGLFGASSDPFGKAAKASFGSLQAFMATLLTMTGIALPWLLVLGIAVLIVRFRRMRRQLADHLRPEDETPAATL